MARMERLDRIADAAGRDAGELTVVELEPRPRPARGCDWMRSWNKTCRAGD